MDCPACGTATVPFAVPDDLRSCVRGEEAVVALCPSCLTLSPADSVPDDAPSLSSIHSVFPDGGGAVPLALLVGMLDSLTTYRTEVETLVDRCERAGIDPLLAIDRLATDRSLDPVVDLDRRRHQLEQFLD